MAVAQLVHPACGRGRQSRRAFFHVPRQAASRRWSRNWPLWRAISTGLGFALIGLAMMVLAIGAAGVASPASGLHGAVPVAAHAMPAQRLEIYQDPAGALTGVMPVP